ncbi:MAG: methyltransferase, partial [Clostridia bacterium]|nr:methyltransferase [Clostridia bacterium]
GRIWAQARGIARSLERTDIDFQGVGTDIDPEALEIAKINAERAGVAELVSFYKADARRFDNSAPNGTVITNPPYGERLLDVQTVEKLYRDLGKVFTRKHGWSYSVITADEDFEKAFGRRADKRRKLYNGMIKTQLYMYFK